MAAVAMLVREAKSDLEVLFIERIKRAGDPWSGHVAFPGGRVQEEGEPLQVAAERETREEIGLDLDAAEFLGRLDDLSGSTLPVQVSGFVYHLAAESVFSLNHEVRKIFWVTLADLVDPQRHLCSEFRIGGKQQMLPAIDMGTERPLLWGLTYRFVMQVIRLLEIRIAGITP